MISLFAVRRGISAIAMIMAITTAHADGLEMIYYDVYGNSVRELRRELRAKGPMTPKYGKRRFEGITHWKVGWHADYARGPHGCELTNVRSTVEGSILLPRWVTTEKVSYRLMTSWQRYLTALRIHEHGHYSHGVNAADEIKRMGRSLRASPDCSALGKTFNERAHAIVAKYKAADEEYDRRTKHGQAQGVKFP